MRTTQSKDGTLLAYDVYGSGPALLFITGATCFRSSEFVLHDAQVLAESFSVYNYDRRGRGDSGNTLPYAIEREIEDIEAMIDAAGGTAYLYGHSSGAILALYVALRLGDKVKKLVLYDPSYANNEEDLSAFQELGQTIHELLDQGQFEDAIGSFLQGIGIPEQALIYMQLSPQWNKTVALAPSLAYDIALASQLPPVELAQQISIPTLVIVGEESPAALHDVAGQLTRAIPNSRHIILSGQDHMPKPEKLLPKLENFLI
ncbi:alpha/beta hydrolase [Paenibacillus agilis]|uniref:Alpha/beta hydrolase n=2 Tax=Paenibacillus agilis TaxID=3020863 RepID=A0A559IQR5_9BACL|nr:alpha/beta hydrolase [Paenibacillus agilis]